LVAQKLANFKMDDLPSLTEIFNSKEAGKTSKENELVINSEKKLQHKTNDQNSNKEIENILNSKKKSSPQNGSKNMTQSKNQENIHIQKESKAAKTLSIVILEVLCFLEGRLRKFKGNFCQNFYQT